MSGQGSVILSLPADISDLHTAIAHYCSKGNFRRAATHKQNLAELYEIELGDDGRAAAAYEEAASWYESVRPSL